MIVKALNKSKLSQEEYTRPWLARLGYPGLNMLHRMQLNGRVQNVKKLKSNLKEDNWIQAKGNFRRKSYARQDPDVANTSPGHIKPGFEGK